MERPGRLYISLSYTIHKRRSLGQCGYLYSNREHSRFRLYGNRNNSSDSKYVNGNTDEQQPCVCRRHDNAERRSKRQRRPYGLYLFMERPAGLQFSIS